MSVWCFIFYKIFWILTLFLHIYANIYKEKFSLQFWGSLSDNVSPLMITTDGDSLAYVAINCLYKCNGDRRCIGLEICKVQDNLFQCRACCAWKIIGKENSNENVTNCRYLRIEFAVNKPASMSSIHNPTHHRASHAVDNITDCTSGWITAHTDYESRPWIKIDLQSTFDVDKVLVFNRQDYGGRELHHLLISVAKDGKETECGYYQGPAETGDRILFLCPANTWGNAVTLQIQSGTSNLLHICEVQIFVE